MRTLFFWSWRREKETRVYLKYESKYKTVGGNNFHCTSGLGEFYISPATRPVAVTLDPLRTSRRCIVMIYPSNVGHYVLSGWEDRQ